MELVATINPKPAKKMEHIPDTGLKRVVIIGGGFAGLKLAKRLSRRHFQVVLIDRNNYHQFQPLMYQVATAALEPASIAFPYRKVFQHIPNTHIRVADVLSIHPESHCVETSIGNIAYDYLVLATGTDTNYFGMDNIRQYALPMKSVAEALALRNYLLQTFEAALNAQDPIERQAMLNIAIVGGGPTGVELAGALAEMKHFTLPKDYPELNFSEMQVHLFEAAGRVLETMENPSSQSALNYLRELGVAVHLDAKVKDYDGLAVYTTDGMAYPCRTLIWAAGVRAVVPEGLPEDVFGPGGRIKVDAHNAVANLPGIYALGDCAFMTEEKYPKGHPQVAPVAIQQAELLADNLERREKGLDQRTFKYAHKGAMATIGRNKAVVDLPAGIRFNGFFAWAVWLFVHIMSIVGVKNRLFIFINWAVSYFTYDQSLRLMLKPGFRAPRENNL